MRVSEPEPLPRELVDLLGTVGDRLAKVVMAIYRGGAIDESEIAGLASSDPQAVEQKLRQLVSMKLHGQSLERLDGPDREAIETL